MFAKWRKASETWVGLMTLCSDQQMELASWAGRDCTWSYFSGDARMRSRCTARHLGSAVNALTSYFGSTIVPKAWPTQLSGSLILTTCSSFSAFLKRLRTTMEWDSRCQIIDSFLDSFIRHDYCWSLGDLLLGRNKVSVCFHHELFIYLVSGFSQIRSMPIPHHFFFIVCYNLPNLSVVSMPVGSEVVI